MDVQQDRWLSEIMCHAAFRVDAIAGGPGLIEALRGHVASQGDAFYFAKIDSKQVDLVRTLGKGGFFVADVNVTFALDRDPAPLRAAPGAIEIRDCAPDDAPEVVEVAGAAFRYSRFHADPFIPVELAHRIKRAWIESYVAGRRGDKLFVARLDGHAVGFLAALSTHQGDRRIATIDLIAVSPAHQGKQVGAALVREFGRHYHHDHDLLQVGTQVANVPSIRLYERLGYSLASSQFVLHLHVRGGRPLL